MNQLLYPGVYQPAFSLVQPLPPRAWRDESRPTALGLVMTSDSRLILVLPRKAEPHGWVPPQGGINRNEAPLDALLRELRQELGYQSTAFNLLDTVPLLKFVGTRKTYYTIGLPMFRWQTPRLNSENRDFITVGGPGELAEKITECSHHKRQLIVSAVLAAIRLRLLHSERWNQRGLMLRMYAEEKPN